jgi:hypothetical protein
MPLSSAAMAAVFVRLELPSTGSNPKSRGWSPLQRSLSAPTRVRSKHALVHGILARGRFACLYVRPSHRTTLERLVADGKTPQKIVARARIVLLSGRGFGTNAIQLSPAA